EWSNAETEANGIIANTQSYELLSDLNAVFLKNSKEAIWQLLPNGVTSSTTAEGQLFILKTTPTNRSALTDNLFNAFENNDQRKLNWVDTLTVGLSYWYYPYKYKQNGSNGSGAEYSMVMRLAEQYLIRAEARAKQNKLTGDNSAATDINSIRQRAGLAATTATTLPQVLAAIEQERRVELFTEWGHRFFDLKRWNRLDAVLIGVKPNWNTDDASYPIPLSEILANKNLTQNAGY
ncbi:MAG: RagB/SusD family nutrient uptake outer membrane protein, partial [Sphingobacteriales bacterium]